MPFGLATAPRTFQRCLSKIFEGDNEVIVYSNDLLILTQEEHSHLKVLSRVLAKLTTNKIKLNLRKCRFMKDKIIYLGKKIKGNQYTAITDDIPKFEELKNPTSQRGLRKFIGFANWFRPFVPNLSSQLAPLNRKLSQTPFRWSEIDTEDMRKAWNSILNPAYLHLPDPNAPFSLHTDASGTRFSGVLTQGSKLIKLYSAKLTPIEERYSAIEKETLTIIKSMLSFRTLIGNSKTYMFTDNRNLTSNTSAIKSRSQRWKLVLSEFDFQLTFKPGSSNTAADFLSRMWERPKKTSDVLAVSNKEDTTHPTIQELEEQYKSFFNHQYMSYQHAQLDPEELRKLKLVKTETNNKVLYIDSKGQTYISKSLRSIFLFLFHSLFLHPGRSRSYQTVKKYIYFPGTKHALTTYIGNCKECQRNKNKPAYGKIVGSLLERKPFRKISLDIFGLISLTNYCDSGKGYILTFIDWATRTIELDILKRTKGTDIVNSIKRCWLNRHPKPEVLHSDQRPQFTSVALLNFCCGNEISKYFSSVYNPTSNFLSERINVRVAEAFHIYKGRAAHEILSHLEYSFNNSYRHSLYYSPRELTNRISDFDPQRKTLNIDINEINSKL